MNYALNLATGGKIPKAIEVFSALIKDYPDDYGPYQHLGISHVYLKNYAFAIENLEKAISLHSTPLAYYNMAIAYREAGEIVKAIRCLELYLKNPQGEDENTIRQAQKELSNLKKALGHVLDAFRLAGRARRVMEQRERFGFCRKNLQGI